MEIAFNHRKSYTRAFFRKLKTIKCLARLGLASLARPSVARPGLACVARTRLARPIARLTRPGLARLSLGLGLARPSLARLGLARPSQAWPS